MFLYNGKYGVVGDDNGLYYMRARYYDISIKRFVNQDVLIGHLDVTSSLNRYAYCEGNPVSYLDPFGLERYDTTNMHLTAGALSILAGKLSMMGLMVPGALLAAFANGFDIGLTFYDSFYHYKDGDVWELLSDIGSIALDLLGIITAGISTNVFKEAQFIAKADKMTGYEHFLSMKFDKWQDLGDKAGKAGGLAWLKTLGIKLLNFFKDS